jgi:hypothetical protein
MAKRLGRSRLFSLNSQGQAHPDSSGAGINDSIGSQTKLRDGSLITTDFQIDLANATAPANSFASVGAPESAVATNIVGVSSSSGTHANAPIALLQNSINGVVESIELICVEQPQGGGANLGVWTSDNVSGSGNDFRLGSAVQRIAAATQDIAKVGATSDLDTDLDGKYVYLAHSGSVAGTYTAGKFILRVYGYNIFDDVL